MLWSIYFAIMAFAFYDYAFWIIQPSFALALASLISYIRSKKKQQ
jgi:hypothetical protein